MSRRNISLNFRRRILATISSLFQRRWVAPVRSTRRSRWSQRIREFSEQVRTATAASTKLVNSHMLTLGAPEFLETRKVMAGVDAVGSSDLAVWADTNSEHIEIFSPITGTVRVVASGIQIYEGAMPTNLVVFDQNKLTASYTLSDDPTNSPTNYGGSGYTTVPTVDLGSLANGTLAYYTQDGSANNPATGRVFMGITSAAVTGGTNFAVGDQIVFQGAGSSGTNQTFTVNVTAVSATNTITAVSLLPGSTTATFNSITASNFTVQSVFNANGADNLTPSFTGSPTSLTGRVSRLDLVNSGTGYFANPSVKFSVGNANLTLTTASTTTGETVTIGAPNSAGGASGFTPNISIGADPTAASTSQDIDNVNIATRLNTTGGISVQRVGTYTQTQSATATGAIAISTASGGTIDIKGGANLTGTAVSLTAQGSGAKLLVNSGNIQSTTGAITLTTAGTAGITSTSRSYDAKTSLSISTAGALGGAGNLIMTFASGQSLLARAGSISITSDADVSLSGSPYTLTATGTASNISFTGDSISVTGVQAMTAGQNFIANATVGEVNLDGISKSTLNVGNLADIDAATSVFVDVATSAKNIMVDAKAGNINTTAGGSLTVSSDIFLRSNGTIKLDGDLDADDLITLIARDDVMGLGTVAATELLLTAGNAAANAQVDLTTSIDRLTATTGGGLDIANNKSLDVLAVSTNGNLTIATTGATSDLTISSEFALGSGEFLNLSAGRNLRAQGSINTVENVSLSAAAGSITTQSIAVTNDVVATAATGIAMTGSVSARSFSLLTKSGDVLVSTQSPTGTVTVVQAETGNGDVSLTATQGNLAVTGNVVTPTGNVSLVSDFGNVDLQAAANISAPTNRAVTVHALGTVGFASGAKLVSGALDYESSNGSTLLQSANASFSTLAAELTGKNNPLVVVHNSSLTVVKAETVDGDVSITLNNGDLTITDDLGTLPLPPTFVNPTFEAGTGEILLNAANGSITSTQLITARNLDIRANGTSSISSANVSNLTGSITGSGQGFTGSFTNSINIGAAGLTANGGALDLTLTSGSLTRVGAVNTAGGSLAINVGSNQILGTGAINTALLQWTANQAPTATNLTYSALIANQTGDGDLVIARPGSLDVRSASIANGSFDISVASGNLTINGAAVQSRAGTPNIALAANAGSILPGTNVITANVLTLTAQNDLAVFTNVNTLASNVTSGSFTVTESNGLVVGSAGINAATDNVTINVLNGDLDRSNAITAGAGKTLTMNVPNGSILGNAAVAVTGGTLVWSANSAPADQNLTGLGDYAFLSASVTGNGENLTVSRNGDLTIVRATTANGIVNLSVSVGSDLTINGPVTAGSGNAAYLSAGNRIVVTGTNLITAGYLNAVAYGDSTLRINAATFEGNFNDAQLQVVATDSVGIGANGVATAGNITLNVAGGISGSGLITANGLDVRSSSSAAINTQATSLVANVTAGSLTVSEADNLTIGTLNAANDINITVGGDLDGVDPLTAGQNITLNASSGTVNLSSVANQVSAGNLLSLRANGTSAVNTAVGAVTATILNDGDTLTIVEGDDLTIDAGGILANGIVSIQAANLVVTGALNAGSADLALNLSGGSSGPGVVSGGILTLNAVTDSSLNTQVSNVLADVTVGSLSISDADALTIDGVNAATTLSIAAAGAIDGAGSLVAGTDITLNATAGGITLNTAQQINSTGNGLLSINAAGDVDVNVSVGSLTATVSGGNLTVADNGTLAVNSSGVSSSGLATITVASGEFTINGSVSGTTGVNLSAEAGNITGSGTVTSTNNVALNAAGGITLSGAGQVAANVLTVTAINTADLGTNVNSLNATLTDSEATLEVVESSGLAIIAANAPGGVNLTVGGTLNGTGLIDSGSNATVLDVTGSIDLAAAGSPQVLASDLNILATGSANLNVAISSLNASVTGGDLTISDTDDLTIDGLVDAPTGNVTLTADGTVSGAGIINASQTVHLTADNVTLADPAQIVATVLNLVAANTADVSTNVQNLVANVGQSLTVIESDNLFIGIVAGDEVHADSLDITVKSGNLAGPGNVVVTTDASLLLQDSSDGSINLTTGRVTAENLTATVQQGSIDLNTSVSNLTATTFQNLGHIVVDQSGDLTVLTVDTVDGAVDIAVASGNLTIGNGSGDQGILGGQLSNVTLTANSGFVLTNEAVVFGNVLDLTAQNSSTLNTAVTSLVANITGSGESLSIFEAEEQAANSSTIIDGLQIGSAGVQTSGGAVNITLVEDPANSIVGGSLVVNGPINTRSGGNVGDIFLDVANGSITGSGLVSGGFLNVAAQNTSSLNTSVDTLSANITSGGLTVSEANPIAIDATNGVVAENVSISITGTGSLNIAGDINATTGDLSLSTADGNIFGAGNVSSPANVTLLANGTISLDSSANQVTGNVLDVNSTGSASLNTSVNSLAGTVTGDLTVVEADDLAVAANGIVVTLGDLSLELTTGNLTGVGDINVNGGDVILNTSVGSVTLTGANQVTATGDLILTAQNSSAINTSVSGLEANVTSGTLTIVEASGLDVLANEVVADNVSLTLTAGSLVLDGNVTSDVGDVAIVVSSGSVSGSGNVASAANVAIDASGAVTLSAPNQVSGNVLNLVAGQTSILGTNVTSLFANVSGGTLTINENDDLTILAQGAANGVGATNVTVTAGGGLTLTGNVTARTGDLNLTATGGGNITGGGIVNAAGDVILSAATGNVTLSGINQVRGQLLTVTAQDDSAVNTVVSSLAANVTVGSLTVFEADDLLVATGNVNAANNVTITIANGNLTGGTVYTGGSITAGDTVNLVVNGTVEVYGLESAGDPGFQGAISAQNLTIQSNGANIDTNVTTLVADITGTLDVNEETDLTIGTNVNATGDINLVANGVIDGTGLLRSATGNVTLTSVANAVILNASASQISGNVLSVFADLASSLETNVTTLVANITGSGESLTINEASDLVIGSGNVVTNNGDINITVGGSLTRTGAINADTGNITLNAASGAITGTGMITGNVLDVAAQNSSSLNTTVNTINAVVSANGQTLSVFETNSLTVDAGLVTQNGAINVTVGGDLDGPGNINAGTADVTLTAATGDINVTGTITGNVLTLTSESANLTTDITAISATTTAGGLTLNETSALQINGLSIAGDINLAIGGDITGTGVLSANGGASNVTLNSAGGITLSAANQIVGNVLNVTAVNSSTLGTKVNTLVAAISGAGESLTVVEADGLTIGSGNVATTNGNISITSGSLGVTGGIDAGTANVGLNVTGTVSGSGLITANQLDLASTQTAGISTNVDLLNASVTTGTLTVTETDDLTIVNATASGDITLDAVAGTINGTGPVNSVSGNVSLTATDIALTAVNQVRGNELSVNVSGSADINTVVNTLTASNVGVALNVVEANALTIGAAGINGTDAAVNLVTGGSLTFTGGIDVRPSGSVDLNVSGSISGAGQIKADTLNAVATASSTLNTSINNLSAHVTSTGQSLTITEADSLTISNDNVTTVNGPISVTLTTGSLTVDGVLSAGAGTFATVDLNAAAGRINTTPTGTINGTSLNLRAQDTSSITTNVGTLTANVTGSGQGLAVTEFDSLTVGASGVRANGGDINLKVGDQAQGSLLLSGPVNAGSGNVTLDVNLAISGSGLVTGNVLDVTVARSASLNTQVNAIQGEMTGASQTLTISEADGINIGADNLAASGANGRIFITANGPIGGSGSIFANTGTTNVTLNATNGGITIGGKVDAGNQGTVVLLSTGAVAMGSPRQITADTLVLNSAGSANLGTEVAKLSAVVRNANATLTVSEYDGLQILANTAVTNNGAIAITTGTGAAGSLVIAGPVNAVANTVTLSSQNGGISTSGSGLVTGGNLFITSLGNVALATNVTGLAATVSGSGNTLTINEANSLTIINSGNVVQTTDGNIAITLATGSLSGAGVINAGTGSVTLNASNGSITLTTANQVRGGLLTATANGTSAINTAVNSLNVTLLGSGSSLSIVEANDVAIDRISTVNGAVTIRSLTGSLTGAGNLTAGTANVALTAANSIAMTGRITANNLTLLASNGNVAANTTVNGVSANATGSITINETDNLTLLSAGLNAGTNVTVNAGGSINGEGNVVASATTGQIILNAASGTTLNTRAGQVRGDSLLVAGGGVSTINTTVTNLAATLNGSLTVTETNGLAIDPDVDTSTGNGNVTLNVLLGNLAVTSNITAGIGIVTLNASKGNITGLGLISAANLVATAQTGIDVSTNVTNLNAVVTSTGNLSVNETNNLTVLTATTVRGNISLTAGGDIETRTVTGKAAPLGNVAFTTPGNVAINGTLTTNVLDLSGVDGNVTVLAAGRITTGRAAGSVINQLTGNGVIWEVTTNSSTVGDTGNGSLRNAITGINAFQGKSQLTLANQTILLNTALPAVSREIHISGNGNVTIQGAANNRFSGLTLSANNSTVDGIKLANFGAPALYLIGGRTAAVDIDVSNLTIDNSRIGIQAVNNLAGSTITSTTVGFSNLTHAYRTNSYGIMLSAARDIAVGGTSNTSFGAASGGVSVSNVAIGIAATGASAGSAIRNADISRINSGAGYALSLASATGLTIEASRVSNSTVGLFASGFCTGSVVKNASTMMAAGIGTNFSVRNSRNLVITN